MSVLRRASSLHPEARTPAGHACGEMRCLPLEVHGLPVESTQGDRAVLFGVMSCCVGARPQLNQPWRRWNQKDQAKSGRCGLSQTFRTASGIGTGVLQEQSTADSSSQATSRSTTEGRSDRGLRWPMFLLWREADRVSDHRSHRRLWSESPSNRRQGPRGVCRPEGARIPEGWLSVPVPQLQHLSRFLWILSSSTNGEATHRQTSTSTRAPAISEVVRRLAEKKGSPRIDFETVLFMRKRGALAGDPRPAP